MRLGLIVRADNGGLGNQTKELYDWLKPTKTLVIDISGYNKAHNQHGYDNHFERYQGDGVMVSVNFPSDTQIDQFLEGLDIVMTVESPYSYYLYQRANELGIKTVQQFNYEFIDFWVHPEWPKPTLLLAPSMWNYHQIDAGGGESIWGTKLEYMPVPVNRTVFPFKRKTAAKKFLHIAGHSTYADRNGTKTVLDSLSFIQSTDIKILVRSQYELGYPVTDYRLSVETKDVPNYWELYQNEDVLLLPRKYGGLSLQLAEGMSCGMIPVMLDIEPQNKFLVPEMLVPSHHVETISPRTVIDVYNCTPQDLARKIDELANMPTEKITELSEYCDNYSQEIGWENMREKYVEMLERCLRS